MLQPDAALPGPSPLHQVGWPPAQSRHSRTLHSAAWLPAPLPPVAPQRSSEPVCTCQTLSYLFCSNSIPAQTPMQARKGNGMSFASGCTAQSKVSVEPFVVSVLLERWTADLARSAATAVDSGKAVAMLSTAVRAPADWAF